MKNNRTQKNPGKDEKNNSPAKHRGFLGSSGAIDQLEHVLYHPDDDTVRLGLLWPRSRAPSLIPFRVSARDWRRREKLPSWNSSNRFRSIRKKVPSLSEKGFFFWRPSTSVKERKRSKFRILIWIGDEEERISAVGSNYFDFKSNPSF